MAFKKIMTGGACQPNDSNATGLRQNPLTSFIDQIITGPGFSRQQAEGFVPRNQMNALNAQQQQYPQDPMAQELMDRQFMMGMPSMNAHYDDKMMEQLFANMNFNEGRQMPPMMENPQMYQNEMMEQLFNSPQLPMHEVERTGQPMGYDRPWMNRNYINMNQYDMPRDRIATTAQVVEMKEEIKVDESMKQAEEKEKLKLNTGNLIEALENSENPKFKNSKFLKFIKKLNYGAYKIEDHGLVKDKALIEKFKEDDKIHQLEREFQKMENLKELSAESKQKQEQMNKMIENILRQKGNEDDWDFDEIGDDLDLNEQDIVRELNGNQDEPRAEPKIREYDFVKQNEFKDQINLFELALQLIREGKINQAILALEAEVQQNPESSEGWRLLGQLHQDNDEDDKAIACLLRGYQVDPYNLDSLLCLGISCTNELKEIDAMHNLEQWLKFHPDYSNLKFIEEMENTTDSESKKNYLIDVCKQALEVNPNDVNLYVALGVLSFIEFDYFKAGTFFEKAVPLKPLDPSIWNKFGAAHANDMQYDKAIQAYHQCLELKPNYVRTWANLGIAYSNKGDYKRACTYFLCALSLNPNATHIWKYLDQAFSSMRRYDLVSKARKEMNVDAFRDEFDIITRETLPQPSAEGLENAMRSLGLFVPEDLHKTIAREFNSPTNKSI